MKSKRSIDKIFNSYRKIVRVGEQGGWRNADGSPKCGASDRHNWHMAPRVEFGSSRLALFLNTKKDCRPHPNLIRT